MRYEYRYETYAFDQPNEIQAELDVYAAAHWRVHTFIRNPGGWYSVLYERELDLA